MAKNDWTVDKSKKDRFGKPIVKVTNKKTGKTKTLLNPSQRGRKYSKELHTKTDVFTGEKLTTTKLAWRSGYLKAREDAARAYKASKGQKYNGSYKNRKTKNDKINDIISL